MCTGAALQTARHYVGHLGVVIVTEQPGWKCSFIAFNSTGVQRKNLPAVSLLMSTLPQFYCCLFQGSQTF